MTDTRVFIRIILKQFTNELEELEEGFLEESASFGKIVFISISIETFCFFLFLILFQFVFPSFVDNLLDLIRIIDFDVDLASSEPIERQVQFAQICFKSLSFFLCDISFILNMVVGDNIAQIVDISFLILHNWTTLSSLGLKQRSLVSVAGQLPPFPSLQGVVIEDGSQHLGNPIY